MKTYNSSGSDSDSKRLVLLERTPSYSVLNYKQSYVTGREREREREREDGRERDM